jgi:predicted alpha/beta-fold hydrolase
MSEYNNSSRCYHSGETGDIDFLYRTLRAREPQTPMAAVGFSIGGNVLLKWLGEQGSNIQLKSWSSVIKRSRFTTGSGGLRNKEG